MTTPIGKGTRDSGAPKSARASGMRQAKTGSSETNPTTAKYIQRDQALKIAQRIASDNSELMRRLA